MNTHNQKEAKIENIQDMERFCKTDTVKNIAFLVCFLIFEKKWFMWEILRYILMN